MIAQTPFNLITSSADMAKMYSERDGVPGDDGRDLREIGWKPMKSTQYYSPLPDLASLNGRLRDERRSADVPRRFTRTTPPVSVTFVLKNRRILPLNYCLVDFSKPETNIAKAMGLAQWTKGQRNLYAHQQCNPEDYLTVATTYAKSIA